MARCCGSDSAKRVFKPAHKGASSCCGTASTCKTVKGCSDKKLRFSIYSRWGNKKCVATQVYGENKYVCRLDRRQQLGQLPARCCYD